VFELENHPDGFPLEDGQSQIRLVNQMLTAVALWKDGMACKATPFPHSSSSLELLSFAPFSGSNASCLGEHALQWVLVLGRARPSVGPMPRAWASTPFSGSIAACLGEHALQWVHCLVLWRARPSVGPLPRAWVAGAHQCSMVQLPTPFSLSRKASQDTGVGLIAFRGGCAFCVGS
jgi:hypothetical protein